MLQAGKKDVKINKEDKAFYIVFRYVSQTELA